MDIFQICEVVSIISSNPCGICSDMDEADLFNTTFEFPAELGDYLYPIINELVELFDDLNCPLDGM
jgi:hypothetical protein